MQAGSIITSARQGLSDTGKHRWSDARLLTLLNDGLTILAVDTTIFLTQKYVELVKDLSEYDISAYALKILRAEYQGKRLTLTTHENLDKLNPNWKTVKSNVFTHILTDKKSPGKFILYPIVSQLNNTLVEQSDTYGIISDISYTDYELVMSDSIGEIGTPDAAGWLLVHYCKKIPTITSLTDNIDIEDFCSTALTHYIVARALRDNMDTQNRGLAAEELKLFEDVKEKYSIAKSKLYAGETVETNYRGAF